MLACVLALPAAQASAQETAPPPPANREPGRAFRGLFNGATGRTTYRGGLDLTVSLTGAYDTNLAGERGQPGSSLDPRIHTEGAYAASDVSLRFNREWGRTVVDADATSSFRYYPDFEDLNAAAHRAQIGVTFAPRPSTRFALGSHASYSPFYSFRVFPALPQLPGAVQPPLPNDVDFAAVRRDVLMYGATTEVAQDIGRRSEVSASYAWRASEFDEGPNQDLTDATATARGRFGVGRDASLLFGYSRQQGTYGDGSGERRTSVDGIDVGADYARRHSPTRRTRFEFGSGAARIDQHGIDYYRLTANASVNHEMGRTWRARLQYRRGASLVEAFDQPFYADSISASVSGLFSRRIEYDGTAGFSSGDAGLTGRSPRYDALTASSQVRVAITRELAVYGQYLFYDYKFRSGIAPLPPGFPEDLSRHSVRAGLTLWLPLWR